MYIYFYKNYAPPHSLHYKFTSDEMNCVEIIVCNTLTLLHFCPGGDLRTHFYTQREKPRKICNNIFFLQKVCEI